MHCSRAASTPRQDAALIAEMLSLPNDGRYPALELAAEQRRQKTLEALTAQVEALSRSKSGADDFRGCALDRPNEPGSSRSDSGPVENASRAADRHVRPEFEPPWIGRPYVTALSLNRLGEREIVAMIDRVTGNKALPESIRQDIIERTDGIPLFVEEMTKAVLEAESEGEARKHCCDGSFLGSGRACKPARVADGAARPARPCEGGGADRSGHRPRVLLSIIGRSGWPTGA